MDIEYKKDGLTTSPIGLAGIQFVVADSLSALAEYEEDWNDLLYSHSTALPTSSYAWISSYFEHFTTADESWLCIFAYHNDALVAVLPLLVRHHFLGTITLESPKNSETLGVSPVLHSECAKLVLDPLIEYTLACRKNVICIKLTDVPSNSELIEYLPHKLHIIDSTRIGRFIPILDNFDEYYASLSKNFKSNMHKASNKLKQFENVNYQFIREENASADYINEYNRVENASWKGRNNSSILSSNKLTNFYNVLSQRLYKAGALEWHILYIDNHAIAMNMAIRNKSSLILWKLGYDESFSKCSPGGMLLQKLIEISSDDPELNEINLITDASWYDNWNMDKRGYYDLRLYRKTLRSLLLGYLPNKIKIKARKSRFIRAIILMLKS